MLIDFHSHLYKNFNISLALKSALSKGDGEIKIAFLTERADCDYFDNLNAIATELGGIKVSKQQKNLIEFNSSLSIFCGRQYASSEGIEVLSLFCNKKIPDGLPAENYCSEILEQGGIIAFSWAFGKWIGSRGNQISKLCNNFGKDNIILLDSGIRPAFVALPKQIDQLREQGFKLMAGSDPLPLKSHQNRILSFGSKLDDPAGIYELESYIRNQIQEKDTFEIFGKHVGPIEFIKDQLLLRF